MAPMAQTAQLAQNQKAFWLFTKFSKLVLSIEAEGK
jgi:hypothetical protein